MKLLFTFILTLSLSSLAQDKDPVVATVNGQKINKSILMKYHQENLKFVRSNRKVTIESSLNDLVNRIIGIEKAKEAKVHEQPEVKKKMNDIIYHAHISNEITPMLKKINVKDSDVKKYYRSNPEYRTSQILFRLRAVPSQDEVAKALELALDVENKLKKADQNKKKSTFFELAQQHGQTSTAPAGGDLGYQPATRLSKEYYENIKGKKVNYITKPFRTQYGIHIVMVTGIKKFEQIDKGMYKKIVYDIKRDEILEKYFKNLRSKAKVKIDKKQLEIK